MNMNKDYLKEEGVEGREIKDTTQKKRIVKQKNKAFKGKKNVAKPNISLIKINMYVVEIFIYGETVRPAFCSLCNVQTY